jgi:ABC-type transport system involved in Fe-S cluster assembly fused permease/ATPase subunit
MRKTFNFFYKQITYLFLFLIPALLECLAVCLLFLFKFKLWSLSIIAFTGVVVYSALTIAITMWRKKIRYWYCSCCFNMKLYVLVLYLL